MKEDHFGDRGVNGGETLKYMLQPKVIRMYRVD